MLYERHWFYRASSVSLQSQRVLQQYGSTPELFLDYRAECVLCVYFFIEIPSPLQYDEW